LAQLESFYAVPQIGAVLVPLNYRLTPDDFVYLINHSGAKVVCVHSDYLQAVESIRPQLPNVEFFVVLNDWREDWRSFPSPRFRKTIFLPSITRAAPPRVRKA